MNRLGVVAVAAGLAGCTIDTGHREVGVYELPEASGNGGTGGSGLPDPGVSEPSLFLTTQLRDFKKYVAADPLTNPAFGNGNCEKSVVTAALGADHKPVYRTPQNTQPTFGREYFDQWYRDVPGTNYLRVFPLPLSVNPGGVYEYDSRKSGVADTFMGQPRRVFLPLDDGTAYATPFGNQGAPHNFGFTAELHATFASIAGGTIDVRADDDLYLFIDGQLVIDLGGTHAATERTVVLDDLALVNGQSYACDIFYAERMGATGELMLRTNLQLTSTAD